MMQVITVRIHFSSLKVAIGYAHPIFTFTGICYVNIEGGVWSDHMTRLEICHNRRDRRSFKIIASCVDSSRKQRNFLYISWEVQNTPVYFVILHTPSVPFF